MRFDFVDLRLFLHICEAGSITGGAARSYLTVQSASERVRGMEDELGVPLLLREKAGIKLTDAGQSLADQSRVVLQQMEHMRSELRQFGEGLYGQIRLLCNTSALSEHLPDVIADYLASNPKVSVNIEEKVSHEIVNAIRGKKADIGVVANSADLNGLECIPFREDKLVLVISADSDLIAQSTVAFKDIIQFEFIGLADGSALQQHIVGHAKQLGKRLNYRVKLSSFDAICRTVETGAGIGIVPKNAALRAMKSQNIRYIEITDSWARRELVICARSFKALPQYCIEFINFIANKEIGKSSDDVAIQVPPDRPLQVLLPFRDANPHS